MYWQRNWLLLLLLVSSCSASSSSSNDPLDASLDGDATDQSQDSDTPDSDTPDPDTPDSDTQDASDDTDVFVDVPPTEDGVEDQVTSIYVTFVGHIESVEAWGQCAPYSRNRDGLLAFTERFAETGAKLNLQIDRPFLLGARDCETDEMIEDFAGTDAVNVVDYIAQAYGIEIDPHRSGGYEAPNEPNYTDVRQLAGEITSRVTEVVGGFIWDDAEQLPRLHDGETGYLDETTLTWQPEILSMAAGWAHHDGDFSDDDQTSGIWIPAGPVDDFYTHDTDNHMVYVAPGLQHANWNPDRCKHNFATPADYANVVLDYIEEGLIPAGELYTLSIGVPQSVMFGDLDAQELLFGVLAELQLLADEGEVIFATYTEVVDIWRGDFDSEPNIFTFDQIDPEDYTCPE